MTSSAANANKPLEVIQKTYHLQTDHSNNPAEHSSQNRPSIAKVSNHQISRKTSVHDVQEATREDLNKTVAEIHEGLARLNGMLETMTAAAAVRDEFGKIKLQLLVKITESIYKLSSDTGRRSSNGLKSSSTSLTYNPQQLAYCVEHFRNQLLKAQYLFASLTLSASIGSSTLDNIIVKSLTTMHLTQAFGTMGDGSNTEDLIEMKKDLSNLEEHVHLLNQRYSTQIPGWQTLDDVAGGTTTTLTTGGGKVSAGDVGLNAQRLGVAPVTQKLSTTSSTTSIERSNFCARLYQKCQIVCCICTPNYL